MEKKQRLENNPEVQKRIEQNETIEKKDFIALLKKAIRPAKPSSQKPV